MAAAKLKRPGWLFIAALGSPEHLADNLRRVQDLTRTVIEEEQKTYEIRREFGVEMALSGVPDSWRWDLALAPSERVEWKLRLESERKNTLTYDELRALPTGDLFDAALWAYFRGSLPNLFLQKGPWEFVKSQVATLLKTRPHESLYKLEHSDWWRWFLEGRSESAEAADPLLGAWKNYQSAVGARGQRRVDSLLQARHALQSNLYSRTHLADFDASAVEMLLREYEKTPAQLIDRMAQGGTENFPDQAIDLLVALSERWEAIDKIELQARALQASHGVRRQSRRALGFQELYKLATLQLSLGQGLSALSNFRLALAALESGRNSYWDRARSLMGLASASELVSRKLKGTTRAQYRQWATEYYRQALNEGGLDSQQRDVLLIKYGQLLEEQGQSVAARESFDSLFKGGLDRSQRLLGLLEYADTVAREFVDAGEIDKPTVFKRYMTLISFFAKASPADKRVLPHFNKLRVWRRSVSLEKDMIVTATLNEIEKFMNAKLK